MAIEEYMFNVKLQRLLSPELVVKHGADEGRELGILFASLGFGVDRSLGVWVFATGIGQLSLITAAEIL